MFLHSSKFEVFEVNNCYVSNYERGSLLLSVQGIDLLRYVFCENCFIIHLFSSVCHSVHRGNTWAGTPPGRYTSPGLPRAGTPPLGRYTPPRWAGTLPGRYTPLGRYTSLGSACWDTVNKRAVRILLECILVYLSDRTDLTKLITKKLD